jgi:large subunit ribosomal protein L17
LIGDREAVAVLFDTIAERFVDRPGGYTRIMRLATPRLGDGGTRAILELVGKNDRVTRSAQRPAFEQDAPESDSAPEAEAKTEEETASAS